MLNFVPAEDESSLVELPHAAGAAEYRESRCCGALLFEGINATILQRLHRVQAHSIYIGDIRPSISEITPPIRSAAASVSRSPV